MSENARGKASSDITVPDKSSSVECPTCGRTDFKSRKGMMQHHKRTHGVALRETVECRYCGDGFEVIPSKSEKSTYCSRECKNKWHSENRSGENHPLYNRIETECEMCGGTIHKKPSRVKGSDNTFCSIECHREYQSIHQTGDDHHNYNGGRADEYGPNWHRQRRKAIERDNGECQNCGDHRSELDRDIHVHHIKPRKEFITNGSLDHERANRLDNLVCLCSECHMRVEWGTLTLESVNTF